MGRGKRTSPVDRDRSATPRIQLPSGTTIVIQVDRAGHKTGTAGQVRGAPAPDRYVVEFLDGHRGTFAGHELAIARRVAAPPTAATTDLTPWRGAIIYQVQVGSAAFGLAEAGSDVDLRGCFLAPAEQLWGLAKPPEHLRAGADGIEEQYWELERFLQLLLKNDPNALETLWSPLVRHADPVAARLVAGRRRLLSRRVHATFLEYVFSQLHKLDRDIANVGCYRLKHAAHLLRLLLSVEHVCRTGDLLMDVGPHRPALLAVKHGAWSYDAIIAWATTLRQAADAAFQAADLAAAPDVAFADAVLRWARRRSVGLAGDTPPADLRPAIDPA